MRCPSDGPLSVSARECVCQTDGAVLRDDGPTAGDGIQSKRCALCPAGQRAFFPSAAGSFAENAYSCRSCPDTSLELGADGSCSCPAQHTLVAGVTGIGPEYCLADASLAALSTLGYAPASAASMTYRAVELPASVAGTATANDAPATITLSTGAVVSNPIAGLHVLTGVTSLAVRYHYPRAAAGCLGWRGARDSPRCQALANLCVLSGFDPESTSCALFNLLASQRQGARGGWQGWATSLPFLFYQDSAAVLGSTALQQEMSFNDAVRAASEDTIRVVVARYSLNGTLLGLAPLRHQLAYCGRSTPAATALSGSVAAATSTSEFDDPEWTRFGYGVTMTVSCNLQGLLRDGQGPGEMEVLEPYFVDVAESLKLSQATVGNPGLSSTSDPLSADVPLSLYPMPVRVVNYRAADGSTPNADAYSPGAETGNDVLARRFVPYDRVSGATAASGASTPEVLRYAKRFVLSMRAQDTSRAKLLVPVLTVEYRERRAADVTAGTDGLGRSAVEFRVLYEAEQSQYWTAATVLFAIGVTIAVGFAILRMFNWSRRSVRTADEGALSLHTVGRFLVYMAHGYAQTAFWVCIIMTSYWLIFFKLQARVFALLPEDEPTMTEDDYQSLVVLLWTALVGQALRVGELVYEQCSVDLFFVDWEKPRGALVQGVAAAEAGLAREAAASSTGRAGARSGRGASSAAGEAASGEGASSSSSSKASDRFPPVSVWRTLFMANEWSELATARRVSVPFTFALLVLVLVSTGQLWVATPRPNADDLTPGEVNPALQFAVSAFWFLLLVLMQILLAWTVLERFVVPSPMLRFLDLCTVAKVSLVVLDEKYHGFYLHCDAPYDFADADMRQLVLSLSDEAGTVRQGRGLIGAPPSADDVQSFELFLPQVWRRSFDSHYRRLEEKLLERNRMPGGGGGRGGGADATQQQQQQQQPRTAMQARVDREAAHLRHAAAAAIARFIKGFVVKDQRAAGLSRVFRERSYLQRFLHTPPDIEAENQAMGFRRSADEGVSVFMLDRDMRIESLIFRGVEWDLLLLDFLFFSVIHFYSADPVLSAFFAVLIDSVLCYIRMEWGQSNLATKTLVDERFLV